VTDCDCDEKEAEFAALTTAPDTDEADPEPDPRGTKVRTWSGLLAPYGKPTGDKRRFRVDSLSSRELPLPIKWQRVDNQGHTTSVVVGRIDHLEYSSEGVAGRGIIFTPDPEVLPRLAEDAAEAYHLLDQKVIGPSVDLDDMDYRELSPEHVGELSAGERPEIEVTRGRISAATLVQIPAFAEARPFALGEMDADEYAAEQEEVSIVAAGVYQHGSIPVAADTTWDPFTWMAFHAATEGACLYDGPEGRLFPVAQAVDGMLSLVPGAVADAISVMAFQSDRVKLGEGTKQVIRERLTELAALCDMPSPPWATRAGLVASAGYPDWRPPAEAFANPQFKELTPVRIEGGRVYGHLASWRSCHIGFKDKCVTAPRSRSNYAHFHVGEIETDAGPLAVGKITLGGGHADTRLGFQAAAEHYDDAGTAVVAGRVGEDRFGIWFSGVPIPGQEDKAASLPLFPLSGDWRRVGGSMELVAALAVNTPGFAVPRVHEAAGRAYALVAAGVVGEFAEQEPEGARTTTGADLFAEFRAYRRADEIGQAAVRTLDEEFGHLDSLRRREETLQVAATFL
jgi:hypothetical protein